MSIYKQRNLNLKILLSVLGCAILLLAVFFHHRFRKSENLEKQPEIKDTVLTRLNTNTEFITESGLQEVNSKPLEIFLRDTLLHYRGLSKDNYLNLAERDLKIDFPGEKGDALFSLISAYDRLLKELSDLEKNQYLDRFQKKQKEFELKKLIFGENISSLLFPENESDKIDLFYRYSERYLKNHSEDQEKDNRDHLFLARKEIYGKNYRELMAKESYSMKLDIELRLNEREMSIMNESERKERIAKIKKRLNSEE